MMKGMKYLLLACAAWPALVHAQSAPADEASQAASESNDQLNDIIVTAQKRSQAVNTVPMSITALTGDDLVNRGVSSIDDLRKVVPSFSSAPGRFGTPVYTLRGIGFFETSLAATPAVSIYVDETPLPFAAMARMATLDLARVEVLKGPQGTLFGQNSTGGAINYIAARPTSTFQAGTDISYGRFNTLEASGFVSGPLSSTLNARLSAKTTQGDGWQSSATRHDSLGSRNQLAGRLLLEWTPAERLRVNINLNGWRDRSESPASQLLAITQLNPGACIASPLNCLPANVASSPVAGNNPRTADWDPGLDYRHDDYMVQAAGRIDYDLSSDVTLTSLTSYIHYKQDFLADQDGTAFNNTSSVQDGKISSFFQEARLTYSGDGGLDFIIGANYAKDKIDDLQKDQSVVDSSSRNAVSPLFPIFGFQTLSYSRVETKAVFGNVDYAINDLIKLHAGIRYTDVKTRNTSCLADSGDGSDAGAFNAIIFALTGSFGTVAPGQCVTLDVTPDPTSPTGLGVTTGFVRSTLSEDNVSWRVGIDVTPSPGLLLYANVSQGYKSGSFPNLGGTAPIQYTPAKQEKLIAYEAGVKAGLFGRRLQLNVAGFYYDYSDKQVRGRILDPLGVFGALESLVNVPKSRLYGFEVQADIRPVTGLSLNAGLTYLNSKVTDDFFNYDPYANVINFKGKPYPYTPKWNFAGDIQYEWPVTSNLHAFAGASATAQSSSVAAFRDPAIIATVPANPAYAPGVTIPGDIFDIAGYATFDLRAGISHPDGDWRATLWVRNVGNKLYATSVSYALDTTFRYVGMPRTYGVSLSYRF
jgi:outer membrane receptor protein involved in Fe transport